MQLDGFVETAFANEAPLFFFLLAVIGVETLLQNMERARRTMQTMSEMMSIVMTAILGIDCVKLYWAENEHCTGESAGYVVYL